LHELWVSEKMSLNTLIKEKRITSPPNNPVNVYKGLREGLVPFIGISVALPLDAVAKIMCEMHFLPGKTPLIRAPTLRQQIANSVLLLTSPMDGSVTEALYHSPSGQPLPVLGYIKSFLYKFQLKERALIFCLAPRDAEEVAAALGCGYYHTEIEEEAKKLLMDSCREGEVKALAATSAPGVGFHCDEVKLVIHYGKPRNIFDFMQESGQAGGGLSLAYSTVMWDPRKPEEWLAPNHDDLGRRKMTEYLKTNKCPHICLGMNIDGEAAPRSCNKDGTAVLCDWCEIELVDAPVVSLQTQS